MKFRFKLFALFPLNKKNEKSHNKAEVLKNGHAHGANNIKLDFKFVLFLSYLLYFGCVMVFPSVTLDGFAAYHYIVDNF